MDAKKAKALVDRGHSEDEVGKLDDKSVLLRAEVEEMDRLTSHEVNYMEIAVEAGGFSCGSCMYADPSESRCSHQKVNAPVSPNHGCCNLFWPANGSPTFGGEPESDSEE